MRDDFSKLTVIEVAKGVGYRCSNPDCLRPTVAANAAQDGTITLGVAAHVCAASPGGPRYDPSQAPENRRGKDNALWLCQNCGRLIDADPTTYPVELLRKWKRTAQERAFRALIAPASDAPRVSAMAGADMASLSGPKLEALFSRIQRAAGDDLAAYRHASIWSQARVLLTLSLYGDHATPAFSIRDLPSAVLSAPEVTIVAPPGTGKTTTILQLAEEFLSEILVIPLYFRLAEWAAGDLGLMESLRQRRAFASTRPEGFDELARNGRIVLLLDGWNELDQASRRKLWIEVERARRDYPALRIIATTRRYALDVPIAGPRITIEGLSEDQQMAIARAQCGAAGEIVVDQAWRTSGIRQLIETPLYLNALLSSGAQDLRARTKDDLLRAFVRRHEDAAEHAEVLHGALFGRHREVLTALASSLNAAGTTTMAEQDACRIVAQELSRLRQDGQITSLPEPAAILDLLTRHHSLMRSGDGAGTVAFHHQQLQEWYAADEVVRLMQASAAGDEAGRVYLRAAVLDRPAWEESVFFAVERLSREPGGAAVVASAIRLALPIDPMLAAEMIYRGNEPAWNSVLDQVLAFVDRWHRSGAVDRAVRFMIITGRREFSPRIWPLASSADSQVQLPTLRAAPRFRPSVLGSDIAVKVTPLAEEVREHLLALIASESGVDGMDIAVELAKADPSAKVQAEVIQCLQFRRADRHVTFLLEHAHEDTLRILAARGYAEEVRDPKAAARLRAAGERAIAAAGGPLEKLRLLLSRPDARLGPDAAIAAAIADPNLPIRDSGASNFLYTANERAPAAVCEGVRRRLEAGLDLPIRAEDYLDRGEPIDEGPVAALALDVDSDSRDALIAARLIGPQTVAKLLDAYLAQAPPHPEGQFDAVRAEQGYRLQRRLSATRTPLLLAAIIARAASVSGPASVASLASLISSHGDFDDRKGAITSDPEIRPRIVDMVRGWVETVIGSANSRRHQLCEVGRAIGRFGLQELVPDLKRLLQEELVRLKAARDARGRGDVSGASDAAMVYGNQYSESFARIGGDEVVAIATGYLEDREFGSEAVRILKAIVDRKLNVPEPKPLQRWPDFDRVASARRERADVRVAPAGSELSEPIFAAIGRLTMPKTDKGGTLLAVQLMTIALTMPHRNHDDLVAQVLALPLPLRSKREPFAAVVMDGLVLDVEPVRVAIEEWLIEAADPMVAWERRQQTWSIEPWLELLPFTDRPEAVIDEFRRVRDFYGPAARHRWDRVLAAVAAAPGPEGDSLLEAFARAHPEVAQGYDWMRAFASRGSARAVLTYVDLILADVLKGAENWHLGRELDALAQKYPELRDELRWRYEVATGPQERLLERYISESANIADLTVMLRKYSSAGRAFDGAIAQALRAVSLRHEPVLDYPGSYNIHPASVGVVRKMLFDMLREPAKAVLSRACLMEIDRLRDDYGVSEDDPRHPDISANLPWPEEAAS